MFLDAHCILGIGFFFCALLQLCSCGTSEAKYRPTSRLRLSSSSCPRSQSQLGRRHVRRRQRGGSAASWHRNLQLQVKRERKQGEHESSRGLDVLPTRSPSSRRRRRKGPRIRRTRSTRKRWRRKKLWLWRKLRNQRKLSLQRRTLAALRREESWSSRKWQLSWLLTLRSFHPSLPLRLTALADSKFLPLLGWLGPRSWRLLPYTLRLSTSRSRTEYGRAVFQNLDVIKKQMGREERSGWLRLLRALCEMPRPKTDSKADAKPDSKDDSKADWQWCRMMLDPVEGNWCALKVQCLPRCLTNVEYWMIPMDHNCIQFNLRSFWAQDIACDTLWYYTNLHDTSVDMRRLPRYLMHRDCLAWIAGFMKAE